MGRVAVRLVCDNQRGDTPAWSRRNSRRRPSTWRRPARREVPALREASLIKIPTIAERVVRLDGYARAQQTAASVARRRADHGGGNHRGPLTAILGSARAETGVETADRASRGAPAHLTILLGFTLALALVSLGRRFLMRRRGDPSAALFLVLPPLAFLFAEALERVLGAESFPVSAVP